MKNSYNFIIGAGGFAKELAWLISDIYRSNKKKGYKILNFVVEDLSELVDKEIDGIKIISESNLMEFINQKNKINIFIGIGNPELRFKIVNKLEFKNVKFPSLIHPSVQMNHKRIKIDKGVVICAGSVITSDIVIKKFVHININSTIGHDSLIGSFTTISPGVNLAGNTTLGKFNFIGSGANFIEKVQTVDNVIVGSGAVVLKSITEKGTYVGMPVKKIK